MRNVDIGDKEYTYHYVYGYKKICNVLDYFIEKDTKRLAIDIETYAKPEYEEDENAALIPHKSLIRTLQMYDGKECAVLDFMYKGNNFLNDKKNLKKVHELLISKILIAHNAIFETSQLQEKFKVLFPLGHTPPLNIRCTMNMYRLIIHSLFSDEPNKASLKYVSEKMLGIDLPKEEQGSNWGIIDIRRSQIDYCARDAILPYTLIEFMSPALHDTGMNDVYILNTEAQEAVAHMRINGIGFNTLEHTNLKEKWKDNRDRIYLECIELLNKDKLDISKEKLIEILLDKVVNSQKEMITNHLSFTDELADINLEALIYDKEYFLTLYESYRTKDKSKARAFKRVAKNIEAYIVDPNSVKQKSDWFKANIDKKDLKKWEKSEKTGHLKTDHDTLALFSHIPIAKKLNEYSYYQKLYSTYGEGFVEHIVKKDKFDVIYPNFTLCFTKTGRMSSFNPNLQNLPRDPEVRKLFIAKGENRKILCADFSQIEVRVAAMLSKDKVMLDAYRTGKDIHRITAAAISGKAEEDVTKEERQAGKACVFGLLYGAGADTLQKYAKKSYGVEMSKQEATRAVEAFRDTYPTFREWQNKTSKKAEKKLSTITPVGKVRALDSEGYYTRSMNTPVQGGAGEIMLIAITNIVKDIYANGLDAQLVNVVHDEVIVDCHIDCIEEMKDIIKSCMEEAMLEVFPTASINGLVEYVGVGNNWYEAK